ncbi:MAG: RidA family protein [Thermaerobacter sp.]|nr:RidA family protein [Thermaerobacter sp.]
MGKVEENLAKAGYTVPEAAKPVAAYVPALVSGRDVLTSGQLPTVGGKLQHTGKVGAQVSPEAAKDAARTCALNALGAIRMVAGDLDRVEQVLRLAVYVASAPGFTGQPQVANGASELMQTAFGDAGQHTRSAVGVFELPMDAPVEVEVWVRLKA